jgi:acetyl esterase/lipase
MRQRRIDQIIVLAISLSAMPATAQTSASDWAARTANDVRVVNNITYLTANNWEAQLDLYVPRTPGPHPTVLLIHGGGWVGGSRESTVLRALPYLEMGFAIVNVSYRLGRVSPAPAAVVDCLCALRWVIRNAEEYGLDPNRIVTMGYSAGGHLALTTGLIPTSAGLDRQCPGTESLEVAAVVNWYGITDVADLLDGPNMRSYAVEWLGSRPDRVDVATRLSPLTYVRRDLPPVLTIHGDADPLVPYPHATRLHAALQAAGATSELVTIPNGQHGTFSPPDQIRAVGAIRAFFEKHGIITEGMTRPKAAAQSAVERR